MTHAEHSAKTPSAKTGLFAKLGPSLRPKGTGAPSVRAGLLLALVAALLTLSAAPASAATPNFCPPGSGAGQCNAPVSVTVDQGSGDVYVGEFNNARVSVFGQSGQFLRAFGIGVKDGGATLQTCTVICIEGHEAFRPTALAVDNTAGLSGGDIYAFNGSAVEKYKLNPLSQEYELLLQFGGPGGGPGEFSGSADPLAVDVSGHIWVGDAERIEEFDESGSFLSEVLLPGAGQVGSLAVSASGDFYVITSELAGVQKLKPNGEAIETLDAAGHPDALALDAASGELFISDDPSQENSGATLLAFDAAGAQTAAFGTGEVIGRPQGNALAFGAAAGRLYVVSNASQGNSAAQAFAPPAPGPLPLSGTSKAIEIGKTNATLCAEVNPEGAPTTVHFDYITAAGFEADGGSFGPGTISTAESGPIGEEFTAQEACGPVSGLTPTTSYRFRVVATNANAPTPISGEAAAFATLPPAAIESTGVSGVTADSATLEAEINPLGDATSYRFEYLTAAAFAENGESFSGPHTATKAPATPAPIGAGSSPITVSQHLQGLDPATTYRFRVVALNAVSEANGGPFAGPIRAFTTQGIATSILPDGRGWELVSPPEKLGAALVGIGEKALIQAAASGQSITYLATAPTEAEPAGSSSLTQVLSTRGEAGWSSLDLNPPHAIRTGAAAPRDYSFFSPDLSLALLQPVGPLPPQLSPAASEEAPFLRGNFAATSPPVFCTSNCYQPLVSGCPPAGEPCPPAVAAAADVPAGTEFGKPPCTAPLACGPEFLGATADLDRVVLKSAAPLTEGAPESGMYEWSASAPPPQRLRLLSLLPDGEPLNESGLGSQNVIARNAISPDGSRVVLAPFGGSHLYLRLNATALQSQVSGSAVDGSQCSEPTAACTIQLDEVQSGAPGGAQPPAAHFQLASADTSKIFFTDSQQLTANAGSGSDLYEYDLEKPLGHRLTDLTPAGNVQGLLLGASADGSTVFVVANGVLASNRVENGSGEEEARSGDCTSSPEPAQSCNLYRLHEGTATFISTLAGADAPSWSGGALSLPSLTSRVSANGRYLAFMSQLPLTGYDNRDAISGKDDEEVYLYDSSSGRLVCASCNPTGARPHGIENFSESARLAGGDRVWSNSSVAANIPGWTPYATSRARYQSRYLSNSGRLFFNSSDDLSPADGNGAIDVYQYEASQSTAGAPASDTCTQSKPTFVLSANGCVDLISSGTSPEESAFLDASESGDDVFFLTNAALSGRDLGSSIDLYDARVGGGESAAQTPIECAGDACQQPAVPPAHPTPGTSVLNGPGNVLQCPKGKVKKSGKCVKKQQKKKGKNHKKKGKGKKSKRANSNHGGHK